LPKSFVKAKDMVQIEKNRELEETIKTLQIENEKSMQFIQGQNIPLTFQLIKSDNTYEDSATITYSIYSADLLEIYFEDVSIEWNETLQSYYDLLESDSTGALLPGNYIIKWGITDTELFPSVMIENFSVVGRSDSETVDLSGINTKLDNIQTDLDNPDQYKADVSGLALAGEYNIRLATIQADLDDVSQYQTDISDLVTAVKLETELAILEQNIIGSESTGNNLQSLSEQIGAVAGSVWDQSIDEHNEARSFGELVQNVQIDMKRALGLMHENIFIDLPTYDTDSNLVGARVRIYSNPESVGTTANIIGTYTITSESTGPGKFDTWKQVGTIGESSAFERTPLEADDISFNPTDTIEANTIQEAIEEMWTELYNEIGEAGDVDGGEW